MIWRLSAKIWSHWITWSVLQKCLMVHWQYLMIVVDGQGHSPIFNHSQPQDTPRHHNQGFLALLIGTPTPDRWHEGSLPASEALKLPDQCYISVPWYICNVWWLLLMAKGIAPFSTTYNSKTRQGITNKGFWPRLKPWPLDTQRIIANIRSHGIIWSMLQMCFMIHGQWLVSVADEHTWYCSTSNHNHKTNQCTITKGFWPILKFQPLEDDIEAQYHHLKLWNYLINVTEVFHDRKSISDDCGWWP